MGIRNRLAIFIDDSATNSGRIITYTIQVLIILSLITFSLSTLPNLSIQLVEAFRISEIVIVVLFTIEYGIRVLAAEKPLKFIFSFYGLIDLLAIAPFYVATGLDLRSARVFRMLRLIRVLKLVRYSNAIKRLANAISSIKEELIVSASLAAMLLFLSAVGIYFFEHDAQPEQFSSVFHSLWWSITTLTTVGYGDMYPITGGGKIFTFITLIIGLGVIAIPTGLFASALIKDSH